MKFKSPFNLVDDLQKRLSLSVTGSRLAIPLLIATFVGIITGYVIVLFIKYIDISEKFFFGHFLDTFSFLGHYAIIIVPTFGGLLVGLLVTKFAPEAGGNGVPEVMKAIALRGGRIRPIAVLVKAVASVISIGTGASVGREGPAVQIGAGIGSSTARMFKLSESRVKNLVACGSAAGISAVFNAPITGVMFALEIILKDFGAKALSTVVVSSVSASIISRVYLGESPAFTLPVYKLASPFEIFLYLALGILSAFTALFFIFVFDRAEKVFMPWRFPKWLKTAAGGLIIGLIGAHFPEVFGMGFQAIENMLHSHYTIMLLLAFAFFKVIATSVSLGTGSSGGTFAPTLFVGAALGGAFGKLCGGHLPFSVGPAGAYAMVGMASVFAGSFHAPVTAILLIFEMTGDYQMILPIMSAAVVAASLTQLMSRVSIDTVKLKEEGIDIESMEEVRVLGAIQVRDAMTQDFILIPRNMAVKDLVDRMAKEKDKSFFVANKDLEVLGVIKRKEMQDVLLEKNLSVIIADDIASPIEDFTFPDEPMSEAARMMMVHHLTQIPVMDPGNPAQMIGILKSEDVFRAYTQETVKRDELISRIEQEGTHAAGTVDIRFSIPVRSLLAGKAIKELDIPEGVVLTSIQRKKATLIPEGHTVLKARDRVWAVIHPKAEQPFQEWLKKNKLRRSSSF